MSQLQILSVKTPGLTSLDWCFSQPFTPPVRGIGEVGQEPISIPANSPLSSVVDVAADYILKGAPHNPLYNLRALRIGDPIYHLLYTQKISNTTQRFFQWATWSSLTSVFIQVDEERNKSWYDFLGTPLDYIPAIFSFLQFHPNINILDIHTKLVVPKLTKFATNLPTDEIISTPLASQLTYLCCVYTGNSQEHLQEEVDNLRECVIHLETDLNSFLPNVADGIEKSIIDLKDPFTGDKHDGEYIAGLKLLHELPELIILQGSSTVTELRRSPAS
ncbi:hypothetical protein M422DRAFT_248162 [Sphaerobolus stellatus SS14]|uniref:Uncharacterized protein n=1 Tax=Sphaerobolus stellatus (strain SS14) TaxID=990650 RepID=A0A0C9VW76_SPHS4|nr:hypothetical protein M422DRAFT_248162 [Sphaerobolus stellatus SS14]